MWSTLKNAQHILLNIGYLLSLPVITEARVTNKTRGHHGSDFILFVNMSLYYLSSSMEIIFDNILIASL